MKLWSPSKVSPPAAMPLYRSNNFWKAPWKSSWASVSMAFVTASFISSLSHNESLWAYGVTKSHREQGLDYREAEELSWCSSWSNSPWQGLSCRLVPCPGGNATDQIWRVMASSDWISSWTPFKPQHSNPNPNPLANQLWCTDFLTPPTPLIIPQRLPAFLESLMPLKNWWSIHSRGSKSSLKHSIHFCGIFFSSLKQNFIAHRSSNVSSHPGCIFEIHQLWPPGFSRVYSNFCCSCSFEREIIKIGQSSRKMYSNNIVNFQEVYDNFKCLYKKVWKLIECTTYIYIYAQIYKWKTNFLEVKT